MNYTYRSQTNAAAHEAIARACDIRETGESKTQQQFRDEVDIARMFRKYKADTLPIPAAVFDPVNYGDTGGYPDLRAALEVAREASDSFMQLPAKLRKRFDNSPGKLWEFVNDPENLEEARQLGIVAQPPTPQPTGKPAVPAPEGGGSPPVSTPTP